MTGSNTLAYCTIELIIVFFPWLDSFEK